MENDEKKLTEVQKATIRTMANLGHRIHAIKYVRELLGIRLVDAVKMVDDIYYDPKQISLSPVAVEEFVVWRNQRTRLEARLNISYAQHAFAAHERDAENGENGSVV